MTRPRGARTRAAEVVRRLRDEYPDARCALAHDERVPAARRDDPVGAVHRRAGQHGDAGVVRDATRPPRISRTPTPRRSRSVIQLDRLLPLEDEEPHRDGAGGRRALRRRGADRARRPRDVAGRRPQDRQRRSLGVVPAAGPAGRHARDAAVAPLAAHERDRPGEDRARSRRHGAARGVGACSRCG